MKLIDADNLEEAIDRQLAFWRQVNEDPHNVANAVIATLESIKMAVRQATS